MFCPMCGAPNEDDAAFCGNCGAALTEEAEPAQVASEAAQEMVAEVTEGIGTAEERSEEALQVLPPLPPATPPPARSYTAAAAGVPTSGLAIASLVLGVGGLTVLPFVGSIVAIILGYMARSDIRRRPGEVSGDGIALTGIVLGWIAVGLAVLGVCGLTVCGLFAIRGSASGTW